MSKKHYNIFRDLSLLSYIGVMMVVPIIGAVYLGNLLDEKLGTKHTFMIVFIILGVGASFLNVYKITIKYIKNKR